MVKELLSKNCCFYLFLTLPVFLFSPLIPNISSAAVMPNFGRLQPITTSLNTAIDVAVDSSGYRYVAESGSNDVVIFDNNGQYSAVLADLPQPISVAVDGLGRIYVGNKDTANVEVYDSSLNFLFQLGIGVGEFYQPNDILIASSGLIYVADREADLVKVYNSDGTYSTSIGTPGNGDGEFHRPVALAIDEVASELIVIDRKLSMTSNWVWIDGARIQVFDINGTFKRGFEVFGPAAGDLFKPQGLANDDQGRLYITDSYHNVVFVYDVITGVHLGTVYDLNDPMKIPMGITLDDNDILHVAARGTGQLERYQISGAP